VDRSILISAGDPGPRLGNLQGLFNASKTKMGVEVKPVLLCSALIRYSFNFPIFLHFIAESKYVTQTGGKFV